MHLQGANGGYQDHAVGHQPTVAAFDVEELLHADVRPKTSLRQHVAIWPHQLQRQLVGNDGGVAVGDVGEGAGMDEGGRALQCLHQGGHDGVFHQNGQRAAQPQVVGGNGFASAAGANDHAAQPLAHVGQGGGEGQDGHDLAGDGNIETGLAGEFFLWPFADGDAAQIAVVGVGDPSPGDAVRVNIQPGKAAALFGRQFVGIRFVDAQLLQAAQHNRGKGALSFFVRRAETVKQGVIALVRFVMHAGVDGGGQEVVGGGDGVNVAGQVEVEVFHGDDLAVAAAGGATLNAEGWPLAGLAHAGEDALIQVGA